MRQAQTIITFSFFTDAYIFAAKNVDKPSMSNIVSAYKFLTIS